MRDRLGLLAHRAGYLPRGDVSGPASEGVAPGPGIDTGGSPGVDPGPACRAAVRVGDAPAAESVDASTALRNKVASGCRCGTGLSRPRSPSLAAHDEAKAVWRGRSRSEGVGLPVPARQGAGPLGARAGVPATGNTVPRRREAGPEWAAHGPLFPAQGHFPSTLVFVSQGRVSSATHRLERRAAALVGGVPRGKPVLRRRSPRVAKVFCSVSSGPDATNEEPLPAPLLASDAR